jgi:hypothetical protein
MSRAEQCPERWSSFGAFFAFAGIIVEALLRLRLKGAARRENRRG